MPAASATVTVPVLSSAWMAVGQYVFVQTAGFFTVDGISGLNVTLRNTGYTVNTSAATNIPSGAKISPAGVKGADASTTATFDSLAPSGAAGSLLYYNSGWKALSAGAASYMVPRIDTTAAGKIVWETINLSTFGFSGSLPVARGGTGATSASDARTNLDAAKAGANTDITSLASLSSLKVNAAQGTAITGILSATTTYDFPVIAASTAATTTVSVPGATTNSVVLLGLPASPTAGILFSAYVSAADTVTISAFNPTAVGIDPASATYRVTVITV
jgi:hypothetical protein